MTMMLFSRLSGRALRPAVVGLACMLIPACVPVAQAQDTQAPASAPAPAANPAASSAAAAQPAAAGASLVNAAAASGTPATVVDNKAIESILGQSVESPTGEDMGHVVDLLIDKATGRPRAAVVDFGGFFGVGSRKIAVNWHALRFNAAGKDGIVADLPRDQLRTGPVYKEGEPVVVVGRAADAAPTPVKPAAVTTAPAAPAPVATVPASPTTTPPVAAPTAPAPGAPAQ